MRPRGGRKEGCDALSRDRPGKKALNARRARRLEATAVSGCGWCGQDLGEREVVGFGAKGNPGIDLGPHRGGVIEIALARAGRRVSAFVVGAHSPAAREGHDLYFMVCGEVCGGALRDALRAEIERPGPDGPDPRP